MKNKLKKTFETAAVMLFLWPFFGIALLVMGFYAVYILASEKSRETYEKTVKETANSLKKYFAVKTL